MKKILITGCSSGFGLDMTKALLNEGHIVIATMRKMKERAHLFSEIEKHQNLHLLELDITNNDQRQDIATYIQTHLNSSLDILINNAGFGHYGSLENTSEDKIRTQMEVNFFGTTLLTKCLLPYLRSAKDGAKIINISSMLGMTGMPLSSLYSASKYSLEGLTDGLHYELAPFNIQICNVCPGRHRTNFMKNLTWGKESQSIDLYRPQYDQLEELMNKMSSGKEVPLGNVTKKVISLCNKRKMPHRIFVGADAKSYFFIKSLIPSNLFHCLLNRLYSRVIKKRKHV